MRIIIEIEERGAPAPGREVKVIPSEGAPTEGAPTTAPVAAVDAGAAMLVAQSMMEGAASAVPQGALGGTALAQSAGAAPKLEMPSG
jgi:hypothetical protein